MIKLIEIDKIASGYNFEEKELESEKEILDLCDNYDFLIVTTGVDIISYTNKNNKQLCSQLLQIFDNKKKKYFCSKKYFICNSKLYKFNEFLPAAGWKDARYFLLSDEIFFKYVEKKTAYRNCGDELHKNDVLLSNEELSKCDFVMAQGKIDYENNEYYECSLQKRINGYSLKKNYSQNMDFNEKLVCLMQVMRQLLLMEENGFVYTDLWTNNIMYDTVSHKYFLIDLGSWLKKLDQKDSSLRDYYFSKGHYNVLEHFLILLYNFFNIKNKKQSCCIKKSKNLDFLDINNYDSTIRPLIKKFFIFVENNASISYSTIYDFFKNEININEDFTQCTLSKFGNLHEIKEIFNSLK